MNSIFLTPATAVLNVLMPTLLALVPDDIMTSAVDKLLDSIENAIANSATPIDDALVLPVIAALRNKLRVPDND